MFTAFLGSSAPSGMEFGGQLCTLPAIIEFNSANLADKGNAGGITAYGSPGQLHRDASSTCSSNNAGKDHPKYYCQCHPDPIW
jgi:hypothetical protein